MVEASAESERDTLQQLLTSGLAQGWHFEDPRKEVLTVSPSVADAFFELLAQREGVGLGEADPWAIDDPTPADTAGQPEWVVLTQRCDIIRSYAQEPVVEVGRAVLFSEPGAVRAARLNSPRFVAFADAPDDGCWAVDLRRRAWLPKSRVAEVAALAHSFTEPRRRKQFRLRVGQRFWRDPVPDDVVGALQNPLRSALDRSAKRVALARNFATWLGLRIPDGRVIVMAIAAPGRKAEAEADWVAILELFGPEARAMIEFEESGVYEAEDVSLAVWLDSFKFDFDDVTYGRRADPEHVEPPL